MSKVAEYFLTLEECNGDEQECTDEPALLGWSEERDEKLGQ
jgi:hypothetical protein